MKSTQRVTTSV